MSPPFKTTTFATNYPNYRLAGLFTGQDQPICGYLRISK